MIFLHVCESREAGGPRLNLTGPAGVSQATLSLWLVDLGWTQSGTAPL